MATPSLNVGSHAAARVRGVKPSDPSTSADQRSVYPDCTQALVPPFVLVQGYPVEGDRDAVAGAVQPSRGCAAVGWSAAASWCAAVGTVAVGRRIGGRITHVSSLASELGVRRFARAPGYGLGVQRMTWA